MIAHKSTKSYKSAYYLNCMLGRRQSTDHQEGCWFVDRVHIAGGPRTDQKSLEQKGKALLF